MNKLDILKDMLFEKYAIEGKIESQHTRGKLGSILYVRSKNIPECSVDIGTLGIDTTTINEQTAKLANDILEAFENFASKLKDELFELSLTFFNENETAFSLFLHYGTTHSKIVFTNIENYKTHLDLMSPK